LFRHLFFSTSPYNPLWSENLKGTIMEPQDKHDELLAENTETMQEAYRADSESREDPRVLIERRAYEIWQQRSGSDDSGALDDWLQAESEVRQALGAIGSDEMDEIDEHRHRTAYSQ
jgi:hypothetical protein